MSRLAPGLVVLLASSTVSASPEPESEERATDRPYTSWIMLVDGISVSAAVGGYALARATADCECEEMGSGLLMMVGLFGYTLGGPILHEEHERLGHMMASGALRVVLPVVAGSVAHARWGERPTTVGAVFAGAGAAMVVDWLVFARPDRQEPSRSVSLFGAPVSDGGVVGLAGSW